MMQTVTRRNSKDSVFVRLFQDKKNVLKLYKDLHPEATGITEDDIQIETLQSMMVNGLYNDLGFLVRDQYILLVEAQSAWNPNMPIRMLIYLAETYKKYLQDTRQSPHRSWRVHLPRPELYVVYSGSQKVPDMISLRNDFFDGNSDADLKIRILYAADQTIYGQYVRFCQIFDENRHQYGNRLQCAKFTVEQALEEGCLSEFLLKHRSEVITMMEQLFDEEAARAAFLEDEKQHQFKEGEAKGRAEGILKIAINMLQAGIFTKESIVIATGLPMETINELAAQGV
ncbi:MAG: hypothetical protein II828_03695 [Clostridia bacterium]|nr:hypothetical protein [Clostridia bacterium]